MTTQSAEADRTTPALFELAAADPDVRFSPHCWKTRMALAHKGLEVDRLPWRFSDKETIAFSGQGLVPVLMDRGNVVADSWAIALYLEANYPDRPRLFGGGEAVELSRFVNAWSDATLVPALVRIIALDIYNAIDPRDRDYFRASREKRFGKPLEAVCSDPQARVEDFRAALAPLRLLLGSQDFICGAAPEYADYCVFGVFMWARCISAVQLLAADDRVSAWRERLLNQFGGMGRHAPSAAIAA